MKIYEAKAGDKLYVFKLRGTGWKVYGGNITEVIEKGYRAHAIVFDDESKWIGPCTYEIGTVTNKDTIILPVNDIEMAKQLFIKHEQERISELQKAIKNSNKKIELINGSK